MALVFSTLSPAYYQELCQHLAQTKLNKIQIVHVPHHEKLLIQIVHMAHICKNDIIQIKDMFQIVATQLQFSTEEYSHIISWHTLLLLHFKSIKKEADDVVLYFQISYLQYSTHFHTSFNATYCCLTYHCYLLICSQHCFVSLVLWLLPDKSHGMDCFGGRLSVYLLF